MIEIIAGVIVLILAIIGIAKLVGGRGGGGGGGETPVDVEGGLNAAHKWLGLLHQALYDPRKFSQVKRYAGPTLNAAKKAKSAIYGERQIMREKIDATAREIDVPLKTQVEYIDTAQEIADTFFEAYTRLEKKEISFDEFRYNIQKDLAEGLGKIKRHYKLRTAGMA